MYFILALSRRICFIFSCKNLEILITIPFYNLSGTRWDVLNHKCILSWLYQDEFASFLVAKIWKYWWLEEKSNGIALLSSRVWNRCEKKRAHSYAHYLKKGKIEVGRWISQSDDVKMFWRTVTRKNMNLAVY